MTFNLARQDTRIGFYPLQKLVNHTKDFDAGNKLRRMAVDYSMATILELDLKRKCKCTEHTDEASWHGTFSGYQKHLCKCVDCLAFWAAYNINAYHTRPGLKEKASQRGKAKYVPKIRGARKPTRIERLAERRRKLWQAQDGKCAMCHLSLPLEKAAVDHDHSCCNVKASEACGNCDRGVLHSSCNSMLGFAGDSIEKLMQGIEYLGGM